MSFLFEPENLLTKDGVAIYHGSIYSHTEANLLGQSLFDTMPWKPDEVIMFGKIIVTKRKVAWFADAGITYT